MADDQYRQMLRIGSELQNGKYRIERYLASGGFGNTYIATNQVLKATIVIKEFFIKGITSRLDDSRVSVSIEENRPIWDKMLERFKREARHMYRINDPNIVRVHDLFEENGTAYYVMDLVNGESLRDRLERTKLPLSEDEVSQVVLPQVLNALDTVHAEQVWHMDLKPANLMMESSGLVKLIDFGASKQADQGAGITTTGLAFTPGYAAPEQVSQYTKAIGPWTDIYSLGATLYNLLTGLTPPAQLDIDEEGDKAFDFSQVNVSPKMRNFIRRLMATRRSERPQSATAVRILLNQMLAQPHPTTAKAHPAAPQRMHATTPQATPATARPRAAATSAPRPVAAPVVSPQQKPTPTNGSAVAPELTIPAQPLSDSQRPRPVTAHNHKRRNIVAIAIAAAALLTIALITYFALRDNFPADNPSPAPIEASVPSPATDDGSIDPDDIKPDDETPTTNNKVNDKQNKAENTINSNSTGRRERPASTASSNANANRNTNGYNTRRTQQLNQGDVQNQNRGSADNADVARRHRQIQNMQQREVTPIPSGSSGNNNGKNSDIRLREIHGREK